MINTGGKQQVKIEQLQQRIAELETNLDYYRKKTEYLLRLGRMRHSLIELDTFQARIAELEQVIEIIADTSSSVDTRDIAEDALNRIRKINAIMEKPND
jgi:uncharacterized protein YPO0396